MIVMMCNLEQKVSQHCWKFIVILQSLVKVRRSLTPFFKRTEITLEMKRNRSIRSYSSYLNVQENFFPTPYFKRNGSKRNCTLHSSVQLRLSFTSALWRSIDRSHRCDEVRWDAEATCDNEVTSCATEVTSWDNSHITEAGFAILLTKNYVITDGVLRSPR